jgi:hypothetical protein
MEGTTEEGEERLYLGEEKEEGKGGIKIEEKGRKGKAVNAGL